MDNRRKVESRKGKEVADDSVEVVPVQNLQGNMRLFGVDLQESQVDDDGSNNEKMREKVNSSERSSKHQSTDDQKMKQVADDHSVEVVLAQNLQGIMRLFEVEIQESQVFHDALDMRDKAISCERNSEDKSTDDSKITRIDDQKKKQVEDDAVEVLPVKKRLFRVDINEPYVDDNGLNNEKMGEEVNSSERNSEQPSSAVAPPPHKFHPRILQAIRQHGGKKLPVFLFEKKLDSEDVGGCFNRLYLARYSQVLRGLSREESNKVYSSLMKNTAASLRVVATDRKAVDYEFQLNWNGVCVLASEWMRLVAANGLHEGDTLHACVYWLGDEFCLALIFPRAT